MSENSFPQLYSICTPDTLRVVQKDIIFITLFLLFSKPIRLHSTALHNQKAALSLGRWCAAGI